MNTPPSTAPATIFICVPPLAPVSVVSSHGAVNGTYTGLVAGYQSVRSLHDTRRHANNRADLSHQSTRVRERGMTRFKSMVQAQRFVSVHDTVSNLFNLGRHLIAAARYRTLRQSAFASWDRPVAT
jgi:hypothetical protein